MNNNKDDNSHNNLSMIAIGIIIGFLAFVCFSLIFLYNTSWFVWPFIALNALIVLVCYYSLSNIYRKNIRSSLREIVENVRRITENEEYSKPEAGFFSNEISELYETIEALNKSLIAQNNSKDNVINIINSIALNIELDELMDDMLPKIIDGTKSNWGAFYLYNTQTEKMELKSSIGFTKNIYKEFDIELGEGFVGSCAKTNKINIFTDIPDDTVYLSKTFLGKIKPRSIMTVPIRSESEIVAVLLLASISDYAQEQIEIVKLIRYYMASAVVNGLTYERTKRLKNELTFQNQLIQNMNEELETKVEYRTIFWSNIINSITNYAIITMDAEGYILMWSKGAEIIRGFSEGEVMGKHITETYIDASANEAIERLNTAKREGFCEDTGWTKRKNGDVIYIHRTVSAVRNEHGELTGYTTIIRDMTSFKQLEDKAAYYSYLYDLLLAGEQKGLVMINDAGYIMNISAKASDICGRPLEELNGSRFDSLLRDSGVFREKLKACLDSLKNELWNDTLNTGGGTREISISMTGITVPGATEKIAIVYIDGSDGV